MVSGITNVTKRVMYTGFYSWLFDAADSVSVEYNYISTNRKCKLNIDY